MVNHEAKTKEQLIIELEALKQNYNSLKVSYESDLAKSKQNEIDLQISEAQKRAILNGITSNIAFVDKDLNIIWANKTAAQSVNKNPDEMIGCTCHHFWADPAKSCENCPSVKALKTKKSEHILKYTSDGKVWVECGEPVFDVDGNIIGVVEIATDITDLKSAEETISKSEEKFRSLYVNMIDGSALHTLIFNDEGVAEDYRIIDVNPAFENMLEISREAIVGKTSREAYGADKPPYFEIYSRVALTGEPEVFETYFALLGKHFSISVYCPARGSFATIFENITNRKKTENDLSTILTKYKVLFEILPIGITISDASGNIVETNQIAETLLGISHEEQEKRKIDGQVWQIVKPDGSPMSASEFASVQALEKKQAVTNVEMGIVKGNNHVTWLNVSASPVPLDGYGVAIVYNDITEHKEAEKEKERIQKLLEDSQKVGKIGGWEFHIDTLELKWTREMYNIHEVDLSFKPSVNQRTNFYTPESVPAVNNAIHRAIEYGEPYDLDSEIITAKGNRRSVKAIGKPDLENRRIFGLFQDVTERKRTEKSLQESEEKYRILVENSLVGVVQTKLNGEVLYVNAAFVKMYEATSAEEFIGKTMTGVYKYSHDRDEVLRLLRKDGRVDNFEVVGLTTKGNEKTRLLSAKISGEVINGLVFDITERKLTEQALKTSEGKYRNLFEKAQVAMFRTRMDGSKILDVNEKLLQTLGYSYEEMVETPSIIRYNNLEQRKELIELLQKTESVANFEVEILKKNHSVITVLMSVTSYPDEGILEGSFIDITGRKLAEEALQKSEAELRELNATKDKFFSIIAHDLRSPFNSFLNFTQIMAEDLPTLTMTQIQEIAVTMSKSATNLYRLLENLLQWSQIQQGGIPFNPKEVQLGLIVNESLEMIQTAGQSKEIELITAIPDGLNVFADTNLLQTVVRNLVSNAVKYTPKGGKVTVVARASDEKNVEISIHDTGIGMSKAMIENLFRIDIPTGRKGTEGEPSTGLGLILCKEFIEKQGGKIWVESEENKGSAFYFSLPHATQPAEETINPQPSPSEKSNDVRKLKILIAEDDDVSEMLIESFIKTFSKDVLKARTGLEAVNACRENPDLDLILMDIRMPEMNGYETTKQIRQFNKDVIIIAQTAYVLPGDREKAIKSGCNDYITKPISKAELQAVIHTYFGEKV
ncbi:MAG: NarL family signal transduction histidine kinase [Bacteroidetes bacterium]|nr:MAG: NarL family signal transduction histidine kinase [Bacteroidota bacterium]